MSEKQNENQSGKIQNMGILDLSKAKSLDKIKNIKAIENVGTILVPESLMDEVLSIPMKNVGGTVPIPEGENIKLRTGQVTMGGKALSQGDENTILVIVGQVIIESTFEKIGYKEIQIMGQLFAPRECESLLEDKISRVTGQLIYYQGKPKMFTGESEFSRDFFELIDEPITLLLTGEYTITEEIPADLIKEKITEIIIVGELKAPKKLVSILQLMASKVVGEIKSIEEEENKENCKE